MKDIYVGVDNIARKVPKGYVGVAGVARKIKKGYVGVKGVARQMYGEEYTVTITYKELEGNYGGYIYIEIDGIKYENATDVFTVPAGTIAKCYVEAPKGTQSIMLNDDIILSGKSCLTYEYEINQNVSFGILYTSYGNRISIEEE